MSHISLTINVAASATSEVTQGYPLRLIDRALWSVTQTIRKIDVGVKTIVNGCWSPFRARRLLDFAKLEIIRGGQSYSEGWETCTITKKEATMPP